MAEMVEFLPNIALFDTILFISLVCSNVEEIAGNLRLLFIC